MPSRPNVVIFNPDSYRGDVQRHLGNPGAVTPCLDAFVATGGAVSYAHAFSQNPVCTPSRCSFMTGWYPHVHGHRSMKNMLKPHEPNLLKVLKANGWYVWWGGKNDLVAVQSRADYLLHCDHKHQPERRDTGLRYVAKPPVDSALDRVFMHGVMTRRGGEGKHVDADAEHVAAACELIRNPPADKPFCIFLPLGFPHPAYHVEDTIRARIPTDLLPPRIPSSALQGPRVAVMDAFRDAYGSAAVSEADWREIKAVYYGMCTHIDALFGQVIDALKETGRYDDTLVTFFSDHGDFAGDYDLPEKAHSTLQDALIHVPLLIKPPADLPCRPGVRQHLTELIDFTATVYDLCGIDPGYDHYGRSLRASLAGADDPGFRDAVFAEVGSRAGDSSFVNRDVEGMDPLSFYARQGRAAIPYHQAGSYAITCRTATHKYVRRAHHGPDELYDLTTDPGETHNCIDSPAHAAVLRQFESRLLTHFMHTADVLPQPVDSRSI